MNAATSNLIGTPSLRFVSSATVSGGTDASRVVLVDPNSLGHSSINKSESLGKSQPRERGTEFASLRTGTQFKCPNEFLKSFFSLSSSTVSSRGITSNAYFELLEQIRKLSEDVDVEDRPSDYALQFSKQTLSEAAAVIGIRFPAGVASVGPDNGVRLIWQSHAREIRLICGGSERNRSYIYAEERPFHRIENGVSGTKLAGFLSWLSYLYQ